MEGNKTGRVQEDWGGWKGEMWRGRKVRNVMERGMERGGDRWGGERNIYNKWQHLSTLQVISKIKACATTCILMCLKQHCSHSDEFKSV